MLALKWDFGSGKAATRDKLIDKVWRAYNVCHWTQGVFKYKILYDDPIIKFVLIIISNNTSTVFSRNLQTFGSSVLKTSCANLLTRIPLENRVTVQFTLTERMFVFRYMHGTVL